MDLRKLQRVIVDALEDIKGQDIRIYNTEHLSDMFERVVIAGGTSNRQTRALASSVEEKVKEAGGYVISVEGEDAGEWVLVDCGEVVVHILLPTFRAYYNLEEIWGDKPVRLRSPAPPAGASPAARKTPGKAAGKSTGNSAVKSTGQNAAKSTAKSAPKGTAKSAAKATARTAAKAAPKSTAKTAAKGRAGTGAKAPAKAPRRRAR